MTTINGLECIDFITNINKIIDKYAICDNILLSTNLATTLLQHNIIVEQYYLSFYNEFLNYLNKNFINSDIYIASNGLLKYFKQEYYNIGIKLINNTDKIRMYNNSYSIVQNNLIIVKYEYYNESFNNISLYLLIKNYILSKYNKYKFYFQYYDKFTYVFYNNNNKIIFNDNLFNNIENDINSIVTQIEPNKYLLILSFIIDIELITKINRIDLNTTSPFYLNLQHKYFWIHGDNITFNGIDFSYYYNGSYKNGFLTNGCKKYKINNKIIKYNGIFDNNQMVSGILTILTLKEEVLFEYDIVFIKDEGYNINIKNNNNSDFIEIKKSIFNNDIFNGSILIKDKNKNTIINIKCEYNILSNIISNLTIANIPKNIIYKGEWNGIGKIKDEYLCYYAKSINGDVLWGCSTCYNNIIDCDDDVYSMYLKKYLKYKTKYFKYKYI